MKRATKMASDFRFLRVGQFVKLPATALAIAILLIQCCICTLNAQQPPTVIANNNGMTLNELLGKPTRSSRPNVVVSDGNVQPAAFIQPPNDWRTNQFREQQKSASIISAVEPLNSPARSSLTKGSSARGSLKVLGSRYESESGNPTVESANQPRFESNRPQNLSNVKRIPKRAPQTHSQSVQQTSHPAAIRNNKPTFKPATYVLKNTTYQEFENRMVQTWGKRLKGDPLNEDQSTLRITLPAGEKNGSTSMVFDRRAGEITFEGDRNIAQAWLQTMILLDTDESNSRQATRLIDAKLLHGQPIEQVVYRGLLQDQDQIERRVPFDPSQEIDADRIKDLVDSELTDEVMMQYIPELGVLSLTGNQADVAKVAAAIAAFSATAGESLAGQKVLTLQNVEPGAIVEQLAAIYDEFYEPREGSVSITALEGTPQLLVVGRPGGLEQVEKLVSNLDKADNSRQAPGEESFTTRPLKHISAVDAAARIQEFYRLVAQAGATAGTQTPPNILPIPDPRSNTLLIKAGPKFRTEINALIDALDVDESQFKGVVKVFQIRNTIAGDLGQILQDILVGAFPGDASQRGFLGNNNQGTGNAGNQTQPGPNQTTPGIRSLEIETRSGRREGGGILFGVRITADANSNTLTVNASDKTMPLIEELINQLDRLPNVETELKVYEVIHGDANDLLQTLNQIFGVDQNQNQNQQGQDALGQLPLQSSAASDGSTLAGLRFAVNERTNEIIATGPASELESVFALLTRLDAPDLSQEQRQVNVYRLSNVFVDDIAPPLQTWLDDRDTNLQAQFVNAGGARNLQRNQVTIVAEPSSNSLIVSAYPQFMPEVEHVIKALDRRPPMVEVKALLAEVNLDYMEEFGIEFGLQDSAIFNAGLGTIGSGFIGLDNVVGQIQSDLGVGNSNGFVFSAGNESVNFLMRALRNRNCVRVLSKPHIMTLENLQGTVSVGETIPRISGIQNIGLGQTQSIVNDVDVGVSLQITPRVSPDGMITMAVQVENITFSDSAVAIGTDTNGNQIFSNRLTNTSATTTIMARSGQTVVFSGLLQEDKNHSENGLPILSDLPVIGPLFNFTSDGAARTELIIILTPRIIKGAADLDAHNRSAMSRMHWCQCDVDELYGDPGFPNTGEYQEQTPKVYYPDSDPMGNNPIINEINGFNDAQFENFDQGVPTSTAMPMQMRESFPQSRMPIPQTMPRTAPRSIQQGSGSRATPSFGSDIQLSPSDIQQPRPFPQSRMPDSRMPQNSIPPIDQAVPMNINTPAPGSQRSPFQPFNGAPPAPSIPQSNNRLQRSGTANYQRNQPLTPYQTSNRTDSIQRLSNARLSKADNMMREMKNRY